MKVNHELKTWPEYYQAVSSGRKTFELRKNDRDFQVGDVLLLKEYDLKTSNYTGEYVIAVVKYILKDFMPQLEGYVIMSIDVLHGLVHHGGYVSDGGGGM